MEANIKGKRGKKQLDGGRMKLIQSSAFQMYPLATGEQRHTAWQYREAAIDKSCRRLNQRDDIHPIILLMYQCVLFMATSLLPFFVFHDYG